MNLSFLPALLIANTQCVAIALPTPNTTSTAIDKLLSSNLASCTDIRHCRTPLSLVWSCLTIIFLCTWVTVHPNVPNENEAGWKDRLRNRVLLMLRMLVAPESFLLEAYDEWIEACKLITRISKQYRSIRWTEAHAMMIVMGGVRVVVDGVYRNFYSKNIDFWQQYEIHFSTITEDVIMDRSKGDIIAKLLVLLQTFWFAAQCVTRVAQGLAVTELELTTLGHVAFVGMIYLFWWKKPLDVRYPIVLHATHRGHDAASEVCAQGEVSGQVGDVSYENSMGSHSLPLLTSNLKTSTVNSPTSTPHNLSWRIRFGNHLADSAGSGTVSGLLATICIIVLSGSFGAIHCLGWNSHFPSHVEKISWRVAALTVTVTDVALMLVVICHESIPEMPLAACGIILGFLYICARVSLLVLAFLALRDLPSTAYQTPSWTDFIPHL